MADDTQLAENNSPVAEQEAPMPGVEQNQNVATQSETDAPQEVSSQTTEPTLPDSASERTAREFDKLREQLRTERTRREYFEQVLSQNQPKEEVPALIDPETGLLNEQVLTQTQREAMEANRRVEALENQIREERLNTEERELYQSYPELNSDDKEKFNKDFFNEARRYWYDSAINPGDYGGRQLSWKDAADLVKSRGTQTAEEARKLGAQEAIEQLTPKEQASLDAAGVPSAREVGASTLADLRTKSRKGDLDAIAYRMKNTVKQE